MIAPFLSASSGSPAPTFHSWMPFAITVSPACRALCTSSIHVISEASVETIMETGSAEIKGSMSD